MKDGRVDFDISMDQFAQFTEADFRARGLRSLHERPQFVPGSFDGSESGQPASKGGTTNDELNGSKIMGQLVLRNFQYAYGATEALDIEELVLPAGEVVAIVGANGAGKSTFAKCLCGQLRKSKGSVDIGSETRTKRQLAKTSYMVMQDVNHQLFCETVDEEVRLGNTASDERVAEVFDALELAGLGDRHPMSLSGGQKQRVAVASALLSGKDILVFDEPTSGMDFQNMERTAELLLSLCGKAHVFVITHDPDLVSRCCTQIVRLEKGRVVEPRAVTNMQRESNR